MHNSSEKRIQNKTTFVCYIHDVGWQVIYWIAFINNVFYSIMVEL